MLCRFMHHLLYMSPFSSHVAPARNFPPCHAVSCVIFISPFSTSSLPHFLSPAPVWFSALVTSTCHGKFPPIMLCCFLRHFMPTFFSHTSGCMLASGGFLTGSNDWSEYQ
ncbi:hypothetical protein EV401DRAFT_2022310 [Pisolithus croceorrhizus]|nr:hypothetical protein EV401DRAFT_2022310 [Pisolithus croceorrhizus]